jgi:hypothetical protein
MTGRPNPKRSLLDPTEHTSTVSASDRKIVKIQTLHEMEQRDVVSLAKLAFLLPEAWHDLTIRRDAVGLVDAICLARRFQHVPKLVGQEGPVLVVQVGAGNLLLVGTELAVHDGPIDPIPIQPTETLLHLLSVLAPADGVQMPRHSFLAGPPSPRCDVDIQSRLDHANVGKPSKSSSQLPLEVFDIDKLGIVRCATLDMGQRDKEQLLPRKMVPVTETKEILELPADSLGPQQSSKPIHRAQIMTDTTFQQIPISVRDGLSFPRFLEGGIQFTL